jgi:glycosyltransferase involved in cell wall biosynthesis
MKLLFVADGRSPTALNWIQYFVTQGYTVHLASTFPCAGLAGLASLTRLPAGLEGAWLPRRGADDLPRAAGAPEQETLEKVRGRAPSADGGARRWLRRLLPVGLRTRLRQRLAPLTFPRAAKRLQRLIGEVQPDLVHAMRIPYEGMLAAAALANRRRSPLLVSVWGNDFTLHAPASAWLGAQTRQALGRADALHSDCQRDVRLAQQWGLAVEKPTIVLPGGGGLQMALFHPPSQPPAGPPVVINPRGWRAYVQNAAFFQAMPLVLAQRPEVRFICSAMAEEVLAQNWVRSLGLQAAVELLPPLPRPQMAEQFQRAQIVVSPSTHDGTPNTLLEALACGCYPIAGDIESLREWITPGVNGLLVDPCDPQALAGAILQALDDAAGRARAVEHNLKMVTERAEHGKVMGEAERFYERVISAGGRGGVVRELR